MFKNVNRALLIFLAGVLGNALDHYDTAIYGFLSPYLTPIFFPFENLSVSWILSYGLISTSYMRPFGTLFFSYLAYKVGAKKTLAITLVGVASCTAFIGFIPGYQQIGIIAPTILVLLRILQGFFASGEQLVSAFFILNYAKIGKYAQANSYYLISTMAGITLASTAAKIVSASDNPEFFWRYAFIIGLVTGIFGLALRLIVIKEKEEPEENILSLVSDSNQNKSLRKIIEIVCITSYSYITYFVPFVFLNIFIPIINASISNKDMLEHNNILMIINMILLLVMGYISDKFNYRKWLLFIISVWTITIIPCFLLLPHLSLFEISLVKFWIILLGVSISPVINVWIFQQLKNNNKYLFLGIGYVLGTEILGRNSNIICLGLWKYYQNVAAPAIYIFIVSSLTLLVLAFEQKEKQRNN